MCRLSIVVPLFGDLELFEDTLVSVLQNRPGDCEVLVVHPGPYSDPYALRGEVRFVEVPPGASVVTGLNAAFTAARGEVLHVLRGGTIATDGWTEAAVQHFHNPKTGAVAPLVVDGQASERLVAAGVFVNRAGQRCVHGRGESVLALGRLLDREVDGPTLDAAFYRTSAILALGGLAEHVGDQLADADIGFSLRALGWRMVIEPESRLLGQVSPPASSRSFAAGRFAERLYRRRLAVQGIMSTPWTHWLAVAATWLRSAYRWSSTTNLLGRLVASCEGRAYAAHRAKLLGTGAPSESQTASPLRKRAA